MKHSLLLFILSFLCIKGTAQGESVKVSNIIVTYGTSNVNYDRMSVDDFLKLAPEGMDYVFDHEDMNEDYFGGRASSESFTALLGLRFKDENGQGYSTNPTLRIGVSYHRYSDLQMQLYNSETYVIDTLVSNQTGEEFPVDSTYYKNVYADYSTQQVRLDASMIYRTKPEARLSLYGGIGFSAGISFGNETNVNRNETANWTNPEINAPSNYESKGERGVFSNEEGYIFSGYIPLGIDYRLAKEHPLWSNISVICEMRPSLELIDIPELKTYVDGDFQVQFGFRMNVADI